MKMIVDCDLEKDIENKREYEDCADYPLCEICEKYPVEHGIGRCQHCMSDLYKKLTRVIRENFKDFDINDILEDLEDKDISLEDVFRKIF